MDNEPRSAIGGDQQRDDNSDARGNDERVLGWSMSFEELQIVRSTAPHQWSLVCLVCVDWYDGVECGFVVLDGPVRLGAAVERLGGSPTHDVYHAWLVSRAAAELIIRMGEPFSSEMGWYRDFTIEAPMDPEIVTDIAREAEPGGFVVVVEKHSGRVVSITVVDRHWSDLPRNRAFGIGPST